MNQGCNKKRKWGQSYFYNTRNVWYDQIWVQNYFGFIVLILMYTPRHTICQPRMYTTKENVSKMLNFWTNPVAHVVLFYFGNVYKWFLRDLNHLLSNSVWSLLLHDYPISILEPNTHMPIMLMQWFMLVRFHNVHLVDVICQQ